MIAAAALLLALVQPGATDWRPLGQIGNDVMDWDAGSVARSGDLAGFRLRVTRMPAVKGENAYSVSLIEIDCARSTSRVVEVANYGSDGAPGVVYAGTEAPRPIAAGTFVANLRDAVCSTAP